MARLANNPNSPRQKMINLMYLVFIALLALNVSSEVLEGFELVENSLRTSTKNATQRNEEVLSNLGKAFAENEAKVGEWFGKGLEVKKQTDDLYNYINELKIRIVKEADGKKGDVENIIQKDNLEASSRVMLAPFIGEGEKLREHIESYRNNMSEMVADSGKQSMFELILSTDPPKKKGIIAHSWESALFENMPVAAAVTLLTKLQSDIRFVESETLTTLVNNVDVGDYRVNVLNAFVIPKSQIVTSGMPFEAQIVLAAVDSTKRPEYFLGETRLKDNTFIVNTSGVGERTVAGRVVADGVAYPFETKFSVTESSATVAPLLMEFLYESIDNPIRIAMPGVPSGSLTASLKGTGKIIQKEGNLWTVSGLSIASEKVEIVLSGNVGGRMTSESITYKVRSLPDPQAYLSYTETEGRIRKFTTGSIAKRNLVAALENGVQAAIDDGILNVAHPVTEFTLRRYDNRGISIPYPSTNGNFTQEQKDLIKGMSTGTSFIISDIKALDPAGRPIGLKYAMEVRITN